MQAYEAVTTKAGRYVQGGGCATVGVAGLIQSGGFGSFSKNYGLAAAALLEAEIVTADGSVKIANACNNPDLFWAIKRWRWRKLWCGYKTYFKNTATA
ncbi:MAG: FAD-binding protein [Chitinophagaceae bacterium]